MGHLNSNLIKNNELVNPQHLNKIKRKRWTFTKLKFTNFRLEDVSFF